MTFNSLFLGTTCLLLLASNALANVLYVNLNNPNPTTPYASWASAATNIQSAVDAANVGDVILVTNGIYNTGGRILSAAGSTTNRVAVSKAVMIQSVNGPSVTIIQGYQVPGTTNGSAAIRCVSLASSATLSGFTLTGGATLANEAGGGVYCQFGNTISNCVINANSSGSGGGGGGGGNGGNYYNCIISGNYTLGNGGGIISGGSALNINCLVNANYSLGFGGGVYAGFSSFFNNCTIGNNFANNGGGGIYEGRLTNCIVYYNNSGSFSDVNTYQSSAYNCCTIPTNSISNGANNFTNSPGFFNADGGDFRIMPWSSCLDNGTANIVTGGIDLAGKPRIVGGNIDIGAYEYQRDFTPTVHYVRLPNAFPPNSNTNMAAPYTNWLTAATNIQDAIDVATAGDFIVVSNGTYNTGGRAVYGSVTNRVTINKAVTLISLSGAQYTAIAGAYSGIRCVYMTNGASMIGFTLTNGGARFSGDSLTNQNGGGVWCESPLATLSNCVIMASSAANLGGGSYSGTLVGCTISNNYTLGSGGGSAFGFLSNCTLANNSSSSFGGGSLGGSLTNCILTHNNSISGGGACSNILAGCTLTANWATKSGGATFASGLANCLLAGNSVTNGNGGGAVFGALVGCTLTNNFAANGGGACSNILNNCWLAFNAATNNGGGIYRGSLTSCTLLNNYATNSGGGSYFVNLTNCILLKNVATYGGGSAFGICANSLITNNFSSATGGGIYSNTAIGCILSSNNFASYGSKLSRCTYTANYKASDSDFLDNCEFYLNNFSIANNSILNDCTAILNPGSITGCIATNCILYYNNPINPYVNSVFNHCCLTINASGVGNFTNNPFPSAIINPTNAVSLFYLPTNSPCIDTGNSSAAIGQLDFDGRPRIFGSAVDVGATEFQGIGIEPFIVWLTQNDLPNDGSADYLDSDGDGMNNWQEWIAGTDPNNASSALQLTTPTFANNPNGVVITWQSNTNKNYYLQRSADLTGGFSAIQSNITGQVSLTSYTDTTATNGSSFFYRVGVQ